MSFQRNTKRRPEVVFDLGAINDCQFNLNSFLENHTVPYLYPANCRIPSILQELTGANLIYVGSCERARDRDEVDMIFSLSRVGSVTQNDRVALVECKNWCTEVSLIKIEEILSKSYKDFKCTINFIFCNHITDPAETSRKVSLNKLENFCRINRIHVFTFRKEEAKDYFTVIPFAGTKNVTEEPIMVSFIYELNMFTNSSQ